MGFFSELFGGRARTLLAAVAADRPVSEIEKLLDAGADVNERDEGGRSALHLAVFSGSEELVSLLLARGADPNAQDHKGVTPLNTTRSFNGLEGISRLLLSAGADPGLKDHEGKIYNM